MLRTMSLCLLAALALTCPIGAADITGDPQLQNPVTLAVKGEALSDVVSLLQKQTGAKLKVAAGIADQNVTMFVDQKPLTEVMQGLTIVFGYQWNARNLNGRRVYEAGEPAGARAKRELAWQKAKDGAWSDLDSVMRKRAALTVADADLQAEMERLTLIADTGRNAISAEWNKLLRNRDTPLPAAIVGDLAISRLYCRLTAEAISALKAGSNVRFDSQSQAPEWKLPADVAKYLAAFVRVDEWQRPRLQHKPGATDWPPAWEEYAVTFHGYEDEYGAHLFADVLPRRSGEPTQGSGAQYGQNMSSAPPVFPSDAAPKLPQWMDELTEKKVTIEGAEIGEEAHTAAWAWESRYYANRSDILALLHKKLGMQIISDHCTGYVSGYSRLQDLYGMRGAPDVTYGYDGKYLYARTTNTAYADSQAIPNRLIKAWQSEYAKQMYLGLDSLGQLAQLSRNQRAPLQGAGRFIGLEIIDWFAGWADFYNPFVKLYGQLSPKQRKEAFASGVPFSEFTAAQKASVEELLAPRSGYMWRNQMAIGPAKKVVAGIYDKNWRRLDAADDPADAVLMPEDVPIGSKPVSLAITERPGEPHYYLFRPLSSQWPQFPQEIGDVSHQDELQKRIKSKPDYYKTEYIKMIASRDYRFSITFDSGKQVEGMVRVPLAPLAYRDSAGTTAAGP